MAAANHLGAAVLVHGARSGRLDDVIDERSFNLVEHLHLVKALHLLKTLHLVKALHDILQKL